LEQIINSFLSEEEEVTNCKTFVSTLKIALAIFAALIDHPYALLTWRLNNNQLIRIRNKYQTKHGKYTIKSLISNLVRRTCFWNNAHSGKNGRPNNLNVYQSK
jgi:hypothetical protein